MTSNNQFFVKKYLENTPAQGLTTLFVTGVHPVDAIQEWIDDLSLTDPIRHIKFGIDQSYDPKFYYQYTSWENMIIPFLKKGFLCSLDIPLYCVREFNDGNLCEYQNFIPEICVPIPYIKTWNYNTIVKIDDFVDHSTNPGVWCHSLHSLMDRSKFSGWSQNKENK